MKVSCKVIEDLLPMYYDKVCSQESTALVEEHIKTCAQCSRMLSDLCGDIELPEKRVEDIKPLEKIRKSYKKMRLGWLIAILCVLVLIPLAFLVGNQRGELGRYRYEVEYSEKEAVVYGDEFMTCLVEGDYAKAYSYFDIEEKKCQLLSGGRFAEEDLVNFEADGLQRFCQGGEELERLGGIASFEFIGIAGPVYIDRHSRETYKISYRIKLAGKDESFSVNVAENGITYISGGDGLIQHPLTHITLWVQWLVDDYEGQYYDRDSGQWIEYDKENNR